MITTFAMLLYGPLLLLLHLMIHCDAGMGSWDPPSIRKPNAAIRHRADKTETTSTTPNKDSTARQHRVQHERYERQQRQRMPNDSTYVYHRDSDGAYSNSSHDAVDSNGEHDQTYVSHSDAANSSVGNAYNGNGSADSYSDAADSSSDADGSDTVQDEVSTSDPYDEIPDELKELFPSKNHPDQIRPPVFRIVHRVPPSWVVSRKRDIATSRSNTMMLMIGVSCAVLALIVGTQTVLYVRDKYRKRYRTPCTRLVTAEHVPHGTLGQMSRTNGLQQTAGDSERAIRAANRAGLSVGQTVMVYVRQIPGICTCRHQSTTQRTALHDSTDDERDTTVSNDDTPTKRDSDTPTGGSASPEERRRVIPHVRQVSCDTTVTVLSE